MQNETIIGEVADGPARKIRVSVSEDEIFVHVYILQGGEWLPSEDEVVDLRMRQLPELVSAMETATRMLRQ